MMLGSFFRALSDCDSLWVMLLVVVVFSGAMFSICSMIRFSSLFLQVTGSLLFSFTKASFLKSLSKYFSRILSFLVKFVISDLASRKVPLVDGQNVGPLRSTAISLFVRFRRERLMTLIALASGFCVPRFLTPQLQVEVGQPAVSFSLKGGLVVLLVGLGAGLVLLLLGYLWGYLVAGL